MSCPCDRIGNQSKLEANIQPKTKTTNRHNARRTPGKQNLWATLSQK